MREVQVTIDYRGVEIQVSGAYSPALASGSYDQPDDPSEFRVDTIEVNGVDIEPLLEGNQASEIAELAREEYEDNN